MAGRFQRVLRKKHPYEPCKSVVQNEECLYVGIAAHSGSIHFSSVYQMLQFILFCKVLAVCIIRGRCI